MAKAFVLTDDLSGGRASETISFSFGGQDYETDLNKRNAARFRKDLAPFIEHARKVTSQQSKRHRKQRTSGLSRNQSAKIRDWARSQGIQISDRGRLSVDVIEKYHASMVAVGGAMQNTLPPTPPPSDNGEVKQQEG